MRLIVRDDKAAASEYVSDYIIQRIRAFGPTPERPFVLGLPTGSSPEGVYRNLVRAFRSGEVSFRDVVTFNMDEYVGLAREHPQSYHSFMWEHLFAHVDVQPGNVHILNGNAADLGAECAAFEERIRRVGGIELFLGGIGTDGHIAFNEPGSSLGSRTRVKTLAHDTIRDNARFFGDDPERVPRMALTVGVQTVLDAREVVVIITGAHKALAVQRCVEGGVNHMFTLSALQMHPRAMIVVDEDATLELQVKTVRYFKSIEQIHLVTDTAADDRVKKESSLSSSASLLAAPPASSGGEQQRPGVLTRDVSRDLIPDSMHDRIPSPSSPSAVASGLEGLEPRELPIKPMHERVDSGPCGEA